MPRASGWVVALLSYAIVLELPADASALAAVPARFARTAVRFVSCRNLLARCILLELSILTP